MKLLFSPRRAEFLGSCRSLVTRRFLQLPEGAGFALKKRAVELAAEWTERFAGLLQVTAGEPSSPDLLLRCHRDASLCPQEFQLDLSTEPPELASADDAGFYYGLRTFAELLATPSSVPRCRISDAPEFSRRGYLLDISRGKIPLLEELKQLIRALSRLRYNELQLYIEHPFAFAAAEPVWADSGALEAHEIMELDEFCREHFIELVPNLNSFGHLGRWLESPYYRHLAECPDFWYYPEWDCSLRSVLAPGTESLAFLKRLYAEFLPNFTARECNVGCDETIELGKGKSAELCRKYGWENVYLEHLMAVAALAGTHGCTIQMWGDMVRHHPALLTRLPENAAVLAWNYEAEDSFTQECEALHRAGRRFYVCPGTSAWTSLCGRTGNFLANLRNAAAAGRCYHAHGWLLTEWGDGGHLQHPPITWAPIAASALLAWNPECETLESLIPEAIRLGFAAESRDLRLGGLLLELGRCGEVFAHPPRGKNAFWCVFDPVERNYVRRTLERMTRAEVSAGCRRIRRLRRRLEAKPPAASRRVIDELVNTIDLTELALQRLKLRLGMRIPAAGGRLTRLAHVQAAFRSLWLARNRPGGVENALAMLKKL